MPLLSKSPPPLTQAVLLLLVSGLLAVPLACFHPEHNAVRELASIPLWKAANIAHFPQPVIRVTPSASAAADGAWDFVFTSENWDTQVESLSGQFHGQEWIVVSCQPPGCEEGWALAKRLRRYGFPQVALLRQEDKR